MNEYRATADWPHWISAGGVVFRRGENGAVETLVLYRNEDDGKHYHLPKGTLRHDESLESCASRETEEESGARGEIVGYLGARLGDYIHPKRNLHIIKTTHYFAVEFQEFSREHDNEHDGIEWLSIDDARTKLEQTEPNKREFLVIDQLKEFLQLAPSV